MRSDGKPLTVSVLVRPLTYGSLKYSPEHIAESLLLWATYKLQLTLQFEYEVPFHSETALDECQPSLVPFLAIGAYAPEGLNC